MKLNELASEEQDALDGESPVVLPFSLTEDADGEVTVAVFPSLRGDAEEFWKQFASDLFSRQAILWAADRFGGFLTENGYEISEDSYDYYINFRLDETCRKICSEDVQPIFCEDGFENLTDCDFEALHTFGHLCFAAVTEGKIAAAAYTNEPVEDAGGEIEIGVETAEEYRGRGYGSACVSALVRALSVRGYSAVYECASENTASVALAGKLGGTVTAKKLYIVGY